MLADETVRTRARNLDSNVLSQKVLSERSEIYDAIMTRAAGPLISRGVMRVNEQFKAGIKPNRRTIFHELLDPFGGGFIV